MAFTLLVASTTIDANIINANFQHVRGGDLLPRDGTVLDSTNGTLNFGASTSTWNNIFINNLDIATSIATSDDSLWVKIGETTVSVASSKIEFTGLNGDDDNTYMMNVTINHSSTSSPDRIYIHFNSDSGASSYGFQDLLGTGATPAASRDTAEPGMLFDLGLSGVTTAAQKTWDRIIIHAETGQERIGIVNSLNGADGNYANRFDILGDIWNDTTTTITSIKLTSALAGFFGVNTNVQLWARR